MNETTVTVVGNVAMEPKLRVTSGGARVASFRLAVTERRFNRSINQWRDGDTTWYTVTVWRATAENVFNSLAKGDPVVVQGRLRVSTYDDKDGHQRTNVEIEATAVGHDLSRGISKFTKVGAGVGVERQLAAEIARELDEEAGEQAGVGGVAARSLAAVGADRREDRGGAEPGGGQHGDADPEGGRHDHDGADDDGVDQPGADHDGAAGSAA